MSWDVIIVGGGITGAGTARDCAMRGLKTLLLERGQPAMGTTITSTHLIHGGLRYLLYDRLTTHTTCWDSGHIVRIAGSLLTRLPILWPVYKDHAHGIETVETLMEVYDRFSAMKGGLRHLRLTAEDTLRLVPGLRREGLLGAVSFDEWWVDPAALVGANLDSARRHGAEVRAGAPVDGLIMEGETAAGVRCAGQELRSKIVINAAGPWVDRVARMAGARIPLRLRKGTHLVYGARHVPVGLLLETADRRYVFVVPSPQGTLVGPTDLAGGNDPDRVETAPEEVSYLLSSVRRYLPDFPERFDATIVGARPILGQAGDEKLLSREYEVFDHLSRDGIAGLVTIGGGKMSDFRVMGEAAADAACARLGVSADCRTHLETLSGEPLDPQVPPPQPSRAVKKFLRRHPRLREWHALSYLAAAYVRHLALRAYYGLSAAAQ